MPSGPSPRRRPLIALAAAVAAFAAVGAACNDSTSVTVASVERGDVTEVVDAPASVQPRAVVTVGAAADGTLTTLSVASGQHVKAGQVLGVISSPAANARLKQAKDALKASSRAGFRASGVSLSGVASQTDAAAASAFAQAQAAIDQLPPGPLRDHLQATLKASQAQYERASANARSIIKAVNRGLASAASAVNALGAAGRAQAQAAYDLAKSTVDALTLRAPIAGTVQLGGASSTASSADSQLTELLAAAGGGLSGAAQASNSSPSDGLQPVAGTPITAGTPVVTVVDVSTLSLLAEVDETDIFLVQPGITASVELDAAPGARYSATVKTVDVLPTASSRGGVSYRVRLELGPGQATDGTAAPTPRPGMSAVAHLAVRQASGVVTVPAAAIVSNAGRDAVWRVVSGRAELVAVELGIQGADVVEVRSGLVAGDRIVVAGTDQVKAGQELS